MATRMVQKCITLWSIVVLMLMCYSKCTSIPACMEDKEGKLESKEDLSICTQNSCSGNCSCEGSEKCSQSCASRQVCPTITCMAKNDCLQTASYATYLQNLVCDAGSECMQHIYNTSVAEMKAISDNVTQVYKNQAYRLKDMSCAATKGSLQNCKQHCEICSRTTCNASSCEINCTDCGAVYCQGDKSCNQTCYKQCNQTYCQSRKCNLVCEAGSKCHDVKCGENVEDCVLHCMEGASCNLNCTSAKTCQHSCALNGLCHTWVGEYLDIHDGQCQKCNCTSNIRNCVQRCEASSKRCLGMYCNASSQCEQYSRSTGRSFVYLMNSTAPIGRQTCDNGSDCWQMLCYGSNCSLICDNGATCDYMICKGQNCSFLCKNGATCDVMTCLPGSSHCKYECDATSNCRHKRCMGDHCIGADRYVVAKSADIKRNSLMLPFVLLVSSLLKYAF